MKVPLRELPTHRDVVLGPEFVGRVVAGLPLRAALEPGEDAVAGEATAKLDLYLEGDNVFVRGPLRGWIEVACSRCVGAIKIPVHEDLTVSYLPRAQVPEEDDEELEIEVAATAAEDDVDVYPYDGDEIDLEQLLREQLLMSIPYAPLCDEDCPGLCAVCGADLNAGECGCDRRVVDPRLASLKDFKV